MVNEKVKGSKKKDHPYRKFIQENKIPYSWLQEETGYSRVYMSQAMTGMCAPSVKFNKLMKIALNKYTQEKNKEIEKSKLEFE